eukprot:3956964-Pleurochrysis_carterae.AAC.2
MLVALLGPHASASAGGPGVSPAVAWRGGRGPTGHGLAGQGVVVGVKGARDGIVRAARDRSRAWLRRRASSAPPFSGSSRAGPSPRTSPPCPG